MLVRVIHRSISIALRSFSATLLLVGTAFSAEPVIADPIDFEISEQPLNSALNEFALQSDREIFYTSALVDGKQTNGVDGNYEPEDALGLLLANSGLEYSVTANDTFLVSEEGSSDSGKLSQSTVLMAQNRTSTVENRTSGRNTTTNNNEHPLQIEEIIVTGTHIRGIAPDSSPTIIFDRDDVLNSGASTAQDFIDQLPQNFGGGSNIDTLIGVPGDVSAQFNGGAVGSAGASVNLRGLGSGSTLVLLNGNRIAPSSGIGDFVDISLIPASAIERVEVLTDGASALYGADAVAGVVNFVLRSDFDGLEASLRYGSVTEGTLREYRSNVTAGKGWESGNVLAVYEYYDQGNLSASERDFSQFAPLPADLLPKQTRHSVLFSGAQEIANSLDAKASFSFLNRETSRNSVSRQARAFRFDTKTENVNSALGLSWRVTEDWYIDFDTSFSDVTSDISQSGDLASERKNDSSIWVADVKASGDLFDFPGGKVKVALGSQYRDETFSSLLTVATPSNREADREVIAVFGELFLPLVGTNNAITGVQRLEINVSGRYEDFSDFGTSTNPKVGLLWAPSDSLRLRSSYSTSFNPPALGYVGANDSAGLALNTSLVNAIFGISSPDPSLENAVFLFLQGTGRNLDAETSNAVTVGFDFDHSVGNHEFSVTGNWFDIEFEDRLAQIPIPGNRDSLEAIYVAFENPNAFPEGIVVFSPSAEDISAAINSVEQFIDRGEDTSTAVAIVSASVTQNLAKTSVSGIDLDFGYTHELNVGRLLLGVNASYLFDFDQQASTTSPIVDQLDTLFNNVALKLRGRFGFQRGGLSVNSFLNYVDSYLTDNTMNQLPVSSWTTVDLNIAYDTSGVRDGGFLDDIVFRFSARNLFDRDPPSIQNSGSVTLFGYDPTNASSTKSIHLL